MRAIHFS